MLVSRKVLIYSILFYVIIETQTVFKFEKHVTLRRIVKKKEPQWFWWLETCEGKKGKYVLVNTMAKVKSSCK